MIELIELFKQLDEFSLILIEFIYLLILILNIFFFQIESFLPRGFKYKFILFLSSIFNFLITIIITISVSFIFSLINPNLFKYFMLLIFPLFYIGKYMYFAFEDNVTSPYLFNIGFIIRKNILFFLFYKHDNKRKNLLFSDAYNEMKEYNNFKINNEKIKK